MTKEMETRALVIFFLAVTVLPGFVAYSVYYVSLINDWMWYVDAQSATKNITSVTATLSFTMVGFLAAGITILYGISDNYVVKKYAEMGRTKVFFGVYYWCLLHLCVLFVLSLAVMPGNLPDYWLVITVGVAINAVVQTALITMILVSLAARAMHAERDWTEDAQDTDTDEMTTGPDDQEDEVDN